MSKKQISDFLFYWNKAEQYLWFWRVLFCSSFERWKKPWLFRVYRGLYYPVMWGLL